MSLVLLLHLVMMSKYSQFGVDTFNTFLKMGYIKVIARQRSSDINSSTFASKQMSLKWHFTSRGADNVKVMR